MEKPKLRALQVLPVTYEGTKMFHLRDPRGIGDSVLLSTSAIQIAAQFFDGKRSVPDIQSEIQKASGTLIPSDKLQDLVSALDQACLLDSEKFRARFEEYKSSYLDSEARAAVHAGTSYPAEGQELRDFLNRLLSEAREKGVEEVSDLKALVAPHIDFQRGGSGYGFAYGSMPAEKPPETVVVLGTGHNVADQPYVLTEKNFETPLGVVETDKELVARLNEATSSDLLQKQYEHLGEHSVEFQVLFLKYLFGEKFRIVPVLCGSFPPLLPEAPAPLQVPVIREFIQALGDLIEDKGDRCLVVAGVDFAHVGPMFGAEKPVDDGLLSKVEVSDRELIDAVCEGNADTLYSSILRNKNQFSVCGYPALFTLLKAVPGLEGRLLHYEQAVAPDRSQAVTYAAAVARRRNGRS